MKQPPAQQHPIRLNPIKTIVFALMVGIISVILPFGNSLRGNPDYSSGRAAEQANSKAPERMIAPPITVAESGSSPTSRKPCRVVRKGVMNI